MEAAEPPLRQDRHRQIQRRFAGDHVQHVEADAISIFEFGVVDVFF